MQDSTTTGAAKWPQNHVPIRLKCKAESIRVVYSIAVWGKRYIDNFLNTSLPSMLATGNLTSLPNNHVSIFLLYAHKSDVNTFLENKHFQRLQRILKVEILDMPKHRAKDKYALLSMTQSDTIQRCRTFDAVCFLYADFVWAKGALQFGLNKLAEGYDGIISTVPPVTTEVFQKFVEDNPADFIVSKDDSFDIAVDSRTLIKYSKQSLHPMMRDNIVDYRINTGNPAYVLWMGPQDDLLIRCFHTHPVFLRVMHHNARFWCKFNQTLDEYFLPRVYTSTDRLYVVSDSDELAIVSLMAADVATPYKDKHTHFDADFISEWAEEFAAPMHKSMFNYYTIWHEHEVDPILWKDTIQRSGNTAMEVSMRLLLPNSVLRSECYAAYSARLRRVKKLRFSEFAYIRQHLRKSLLDIAQKVLSCMPPIIIRALRSIKKFIKARSNHTLDLLQKK